ncbi:MAG: redoxin family protein [Sphingomonas sp.]|uniref:redoxin family protein n=1 Tax=Sphingomonas sp. TaxID=28214 RepID=UPI0035650177
MTFVALAGAATAMAVATPFVLPAVLTGSASQAPAAGPTGVLDALAGQRTWLNGKPVRPEDLRGKVVVVNFWTYSCINSLRTLPYLRAWQEKYGDRLVVIGVHTPEFGFEKDVANVRTALAALGVSYPVVLDSDFAIWRAFGNQGWPGFYFIGADGRVRDQRLGEGEYGKSEQVIRTLLAEVGTAPGTAPVSDEVGGAGPEAAPDWAHLGSPETYIGHRQARNFVSPGGFFRDTSHVYGAASSLSRNQWSLAGAWSVGGEFATLDRAGGRIAYRFHARDLHMVLAPGASGQPVRFRITIDGAPAGANGGVDVDAEGRGTVRAARMYQLVRQIGPVQDRSFEIEFLDPGVRAYVFTFG